MSLQDPENRDEWSRYPSRGDAMGRNSESDIHMVSFGQRFGWCLS